MVLTEIITIPFNPVSVHGRYGVNLYFEKEGEQPQRLQFEAMIVYCGCYQDNFFVYHISKMEYVVNKNITESYLVDMAKISSSFIYPLTVWVDKNGVIREVRSKGVMERWKEGRPELEKYYKGAFAEKYFDKIEKMLKQPARIKQIITHDLFFSRLFAIAYAGEGINHTAEQAVPLLPYSAPLKVVTTQTVDTETIHDPDCHFIRIDHTAETTEEYRSDILYAADRANPEINRKSVSAGFECCYRLSKHDNAVLSLTGDFVTRLDGECWQSVRMEAYRLRNKPLLFGIDEELMQEEEKQKKEKRSFWKQVIDFF